MWHLRNFNLNLFNSTQINSRQRFNCFLRFSSSNPKRFTGNNKSSARMPSFAEPDDPRIVRIRKSKSFYYWSIKHSKIMFASASMNGEKKCNLCIPKYRPGTYKECDFSYSTLNSFKRHVMSCEYKFKRPLMWCTSKFTLFVRNFKIYQPKCSQT